MQSSGKTTELVITSLGRDRFNKNRIRRVKCNKSYKNEVNKKTKGKNKRKDTGRGDQSLANDDARYIIIGGNFFNIFFFF